MFSKHSRPSGERTVCRIGGRSFDLSDGLSSLLSAGSQLGACSGLRRFGGKSCTASPVIRTTVDVRRCSERGLAGCSKGLRIQTTVGERRRQTVTVKDVALLAFPELLPRDLSLSKKEEQHTTNSSSSSAVVVSEDSKRRWANAAQEVFAAALLQAPLQLLSPWANIGGIAMAAAQVPVPPRPAFQVPMMGLPPGLQEDEQFAALIFPGFDSGAFVWQITCWQVAEFVFTMFLGHNRANPTPCVLYRLGASWGPAVARGQVWRLITPVMLHANLTHLLFNVFFQLRMGFGMERQFGREKMMLIYFACGLFGNLLSIAIDPFKLAVGASTAGFGLIGVWLAEILLSWEVLGPARERTILWIVFMLISVTTMSSMTPNMDLYGHLGGALGGFLLSIIISDMKDEDRPEWYSQARVAATLALGLLLTGGLTKALLLNPREPIPDCRIFQTLVDAGTAIASAAKQ